MAANTAKRDLLLSAGGFILFVLACVGLLVISNPPKPKLPKGAYAGAQQPIELTLAHTNDTWGFLEPCG
jgi:hypothetical protein